MELAGVIQTGLSGLGNDGKEKEEIYQTMNGQCKYSRQGAGLPPTPVPNHLGAVLFDHAPDG